MSKPRRPIYETLGMFRIHPEIMQHHIFDSGLDLETGNWIFPKTLLLSHVKFYLKFRIFPIMKYFQTNSESFEITEFITEFCARIVTIKVTPTPKKNQVSISLVVTQQFSDHT